MANTIADKLERLEQTKWDIYNALMQKSLSSLSADPFSAYPDIIRQLIVLRSGANGISGRNLSMHIDNGGGSLDVGNISTVGSEIVVTLYGVGSYNTQGYGGSVNVSGEIVIPIL